MSLKDAGHDVEVVALHDEMEFCAHQDGIIVHRCKIREDLTALKMVPKTTPQALTIISSRRGLWKKFLEVHARRPFDVVDAPEMLWEGVIPGVFGLTPLVVRRQRDLSTYDKLSMSSLSAFQLDQEVRSTVSRLSLGLADAVYSPGTVSHVEERNSTIQEIINLKRHLPEGEIALPEDYERSVTVRTRINHLNTLDYLKQVFEQVCGEFPDSRFVILAEDITSDEEEHHAREKIKDFVKEPARLILMRSYHQLLPEFLRSAPICFVSGEVETAPYSWLEGMALQKALVVVRPQNSAQQPTTKESRNGSNSSSEPAAEGHMDYLKDGENAIIVNSMNPADAAGAILSLKKDAAKTEQLSRAGRLLIEESFDSKATVGSIEEIYRRAIENHGSPAKIAQRAQALEEMLQGVEDLMHSYDRMLYDLLFSESHRFKMRHWLNKLVGKV
ncbi:MAG TPA: hypothetical protein V6C72_02430 [Chroococcales cyanobacterium]